mmetsp:Transcript_15423/g.17491  ORF Transcript_15423/g.17491 Transcript_15423/m.17491 type:complete len:260 (-) Transcript_15423:106-885(-)
MLSFLAKSVAPGILSAGKALEKVGRDFAGKTAASKFPASFGVILDDVTKEEIVEYHKKLGKSVHGTFQAPSANVDSSAKIKDSSSVWYGAAVSGNVSVGEFSSLQDKSITHESAQVGSYVVVGPGAEVGAKALLKDRILIGAGAKIGNGAIVESDAIVAPGAELSSGAVVKSNELWEGSPAKKARDLSKEEVKNIFETANFSVDMASKHHMESLKSVAALASQRQRFERSPQAFMEELSENPAFKSEVKRRGLIFNDSN